MDFSNSVEAGRAQPTTGGRSLPPTLTTAAQITLAAGYGSSPSHMEPEVRTLSAAPPETYCSLVS